MNAAETQTMCRALCRIAFGLFLAALAGMPARAEAPASACGAAASALDRLICGDDELLALDRREAALYRAALAHAPYRRDFAAEQRWWLKGRTDICPLALKRVSPRRSPPVWKPFIAAEPVPCLDDAYRSRIVRLEAADRPGGRQSESSGLPTDGVRRYAASKGQAAISVFLSRTSLRLPALRGVMALSFVGTMPKAKGDTETRGASVFRVDNADQYFVDNAARLEAEDGNPPYCREKIRWILIRDRKGESDEMLPRVGDVRIVALTIADYRAYTPRAFGYCWGMTWRRIDGG